MEQKPQKTIYFFRHGQSEGNIRHLMPRDEDIHASEQNLTQQGKEQVIKLAYRIKSVPLEIIISSTLTRAKQTAEIIQGITDYNIEYSDLFVERQKPQTIIGQRRNEPAILAIEEAWKQSLFQIGGQIDGADNYTTLIERAKKTLQFLQSRPESTIGIVTHQFFFNTMMIQAVLGEAVTPELYKRLQEQYWLENTGIVIMQYHPGYSFSGWRVWTYNDCSHLYI